MGTLSTLTGFVVILAIIAAVLVPVAIVGALIALTVFLVRRSRVKS